MEGPNPALPKPNNPLADRSCKFWAGSGILLAVVLAIGYWAGTVFTTSPIGFPTPELGPTAEIAMVPDGDSILPVSAGSSLSTSIIRAIDAHTDIPDRGSA